MATLVPSVSAPARSRWSRHADPFRLASYLLVLFTVGHTLGAVVSTPRLGAAGDAVAASMRSVHFALQSADCTWYGLYRGFGATISLFFAFSAVLAWQLGGLAQRERRAFAPVAWALLAAYVANAVIAWVYFFPTPQIFATLVAVLLGIGCLRRAGPAASE